MAAGQLATKGQPAHGGKGTSWPSKVFEFNPAGLHWPRAVLVLDVMLVPLVVFWAIGHERKGRWSFLCVIAPLRLPTGTGSPVNPIAIL